MARTTYDKSTRELLKDMVADLWLQPRDVQDHDGRRQPAHTRAVTDPREAR